MADWCAALCLQDRDVQVGPHRVRVHVGGDGPPLVLLHGNPTHSFLWRRVLPLLTPSFRCLAVDLTGFGGSSRQRDFGVADHADVIATVVNQLVDRENVTWLTHDWGVSIAFTAITAMPGYGHAVAFTEGHLRSIRSWEDADPGFAALFQRLREPDFGRDFVVDSNAFVEQVLLGSLPGLTAHERQEYRAPFLEPERRWAILRLAREVPVGGDPADMAGVLAAVDAGLAGPALPKLLLQANPGSVIDADYRDWILDRAANLSSSAIGPGEHFTPEEQPDAIAAAVTAWARIHS